MLTVKAAIAANRFGLGARPGDAERIGTEPGRWLESQLAAAADVRPRMGDPESATVLREIAELRLARRRAARAAENDQAPPDRDAIRSFGRYIRDQYVDGVAGRYRRALESESPFVERIVHFWSNHFAISADKQPVGAIAALYEQEAIRPFVTGNFLELLGAAVRHPAMLLYLDNQTSMGPNSAAARAVRRNRGRELGLNENLAREILELHTLGVGGGYDQNDVTEFAKVITGWSIGGEQRDRAGVDETPGRFHFRAAMHEPGEKSVLGRKYAEHGVGEGQAVLAALAAHPATARHIATKLARHFVADEPPQSLIDRLADAYRENDGELMPVYQALIDADESWLEPLAKFKTPHDFVISTFRAIGQLPDDGELVAGVLTQLGQRPFTPGSPAGWPDTAADWDSGDALLKRIEWSAAIGRAAGDRIDPIELADAVLGPVLGEHSRIGIQRAESGGQALALLLAAPEFQRR